jgi:hypothetical protein
LYTGPALHACTGLEMTENKHSELTISIAN